MSPARLDDLTIDPVIHHVDADAHLLSELLDGELVGRTDRCGGDVITPTDLFHDADGVALTFSATSSFAIELSGDLLVV